MSSLTPAQSTLAKSGTTSSAALDEASTFILKHGWAPATTRQYAAAVNKYLLFLETEGVFHTALPCSSKNVYDFILWCSRSSFKAVLSKTTTRYLTGLRMWHALHDKPFPVVNLHRVRLLLKGCSKLEVKPSKKRTGLKLADVLHLSDILTNDNVVDLVTKAVIPTGFWGLARLGELTLHQDHPDIFIRRRDLSFSGDGRSAFIKIRMAKTARHSETQVLCLRAQPNRLDPVNTLHEVLRKVPGSRNSPLFPGKEAATPISRAYITRFLASHGPSDEFVWSGHSLRIGGASFQANLGRSLSSLKSLGRWRSSAYKLYIRKYSKEEVIEARSLARDLHF